MLRFSRLPNRFGMAATFSFGFLEHAHVTLNPASGFALDVGVNVD
jgi:hypothetical protein